MAYDPPSGDAVQLEMGGSYTPPAGTAIQLYLGVHEIPVRTVVTPDLGISWDAPAATDHGSRLGWIDRQAVCASCGLGWAQRRQSATAATVPWRSHGSVDRARSAGWARCESTPERTGRVPWTSPPARDRSRQRIPWGERQAAELSVALPYLAPGIRDHLWRMPHATQALVDYSAFDVPWGNPPAKDHLHASRWGRRWYAAICWRRYEIQAGDGIRLDLHVPLGQVDDGDHINFRFDSLVYDRRCRQREPSGWRDAYYYRPPDPIPTGRVRRVYFMLNQALLTRLPERTPIDVSSISLSADVGSWCWSLSATLNSVAALDLLRPGAPVDVEVNINGHIWIMQVERWNQGRRFAGGDRSVTGRSLSAALAAPAGPIITRAETQQRTAVQLAEAALDGIVGWTIDWDLVDWLVPGNVWSCHEQTPIQIVQSIAEAGGGFVQTHQSAQTLMVKPRYARMPWLWTSAVPDLIVPEAMVLTMDGSWEPKVQYNAAFVSGTCTGGIAAKVTRAGTAGDVAAPMVADPLITDTDVALARGRGILAASGDWEMQRLSLPLFAAPEVPGLILPGTLLQVSSGTGSWRGQAISASITASRTRGGVIVRQSIDVERYHGD